MVCTGIKGQNPPEVMRISTYTLQTSKYIEPRHMHFAVNEQNKLKPPSFSSRSLLNREEWKSLSRCKRLFAAMLLDQLLAGRSVDALSKEYSIEPTEIETLRWQARMTAAKVQKICAEIG